MDEETETGAGLLQMALKALLKGDFGGLVLVLVLAFFWGLALLGKGIIWLSLNLVRQEIERGRIAKLENAIPHFLGGWAATVALYYSIVWAVFARLDPTADYEGFGLAIALILASVVWGKIVHETHKLLTTEYEWEEIDQGEGVYFTPSTMVESKVETGVKDWPVPIFDS